MVGIEWRRCVDLSYLFPDTLLLPLYPRVYAALTRICVCACVNSRNHNSGPSMS